MAEETERKHRGRKTLLTSEMIELAAGYIKEGCTDRAAQDLIGISHETWYNWLQKAEERPGTIYGEFSDAIKKARAILQQDCVKIIKTAAKNEWQAAAWMLERRYPEDFGKRDRVDMNMNQVQIVDNIPVPAKAPAP
jgi:transposase